MFKEVKIERMLNHDWNTAKAPYCSVDIIRVKMGVESRATALLKKLQNVYHMAALAGSDKP